MSKTAKGLTLIIAAAALWLPMSLWGVTHRLMLPSLIGYALFMGAFGLAMWRYRDFK